MTVRVGSGESGVCTVGVRCAQYLLWICCCLNIFGFVKKKLISLELVTPFTPPGPFYLFSNLGRQFLVTWQQASCKMTKSLKNMKNEKCPPKDLEYGEKTDRISKASITAYQISI